MYSVRDTRLLSESASQFFAQFNPTHYYTLTYAGTWGEERRVRAFRDWIDAIEWMQRRNLGWVRADEMRRCRHSGLGFPEIAPHHHGLLFDTQNLSCGDAAGIWRSFAGDARVEKYRPGGGALEYSLKLAFHESSDWDFGGKSLSRLVTDRKQKTGTSRDQ